MKKNRIIIATVGAMLFVSVFLLNVTVFVNSHNSNVKTTLNTLFSQASAEDETGDGESGGGGVSLHWSSSVPCGGSNNGSYYVCNINGSGLLCYTSGGVSCKCGTDCGPY